MVDNNPEMDYAGMADAIISAGKQGKKSGVGGIGSKSNNFKE